jgi:hypothetical protein
MNSIWFVQAEKKVRPWKNCFEKCQEQDKLQVI